MPPIPLNTPLRRVRSCDRGWLTVTVIVTVHTTHRIHDLWFKINAQQLPGSVFERKSERSRRPQWLKCKIRGGGTLHSGLGPWQWPCAFPWHYNNLRWGTLWVINRRWGTAFPCVPLHFNHWASSIMSHTLTKTNRIFGLHFCRSHCVDLAASVSIT